MVGFRAPQSTCILVLSVMLHFCSYSDGCIRSLLPSRIPLLSKDPKNEYVGCFADKTDDRDLKFQAETSAESMSLENCNDQCRQKGATYYGAQAGIECFCGSSYGKHGPAADEKLCDRSCAAQVSKIAVINKIKMQDKCGGDLYNSVYKVQGDKSG